MHDITHNDQKFYVNRHGIMRPNYKGTPIGVDGRSQLDIAAKMSTCSHVNGGDAVNIRLGHMGRYLMSAFIRVCFMALFNSFDGLSRYRGMP